jgi:rare lipoprotein A (peptidoglycan hydrolase)
LSRFFIYLSLVFLFGACGEQFSSQGEIPEHSTDRELTKSGDKMAPYTVKNRTYTPQREPVGEKFRGYASWYGEKYHGKQTANGEIFDMNLMTAAHKTLPMNTMISVKNLENGKSVIVRINDRGPFVDDRVLDLSKKAGEKLDIFKTGIIYVEYQILGYGGNIDLSLLVEEREEAVAEEGDMEEDEVSTSAPDIQQEEEEPSPQPTPVLISKIVPKSLAINRVPAPANSRFSNLKVVSPSGNSLESDDDLEVDDEPKAPVEIVPDNKSDLDKDLDEIVAEEVATIVISNKGIERKNKKQTRLEKRFYVQIASFSSPERADVYITQNSDKQLPQHLQLIAREESRGDDKLFKVWVAGFKDEGEARDFNHKKELFINSFIVVREERVEW